MKILTVVPSIYPDKLDKMLERYYLTKSVHTDICVISTGTVVEAINKAFNKNPDYDFYHISNDDVWYQTPLWDMKLAKDGKITYGDDGLQSANLCTFPMIDGRIVRALGWLVLPSLHGSGFCGDNVWKFIGDNLKILEYHPEVLLKHNWGGMNKEMDVELFKPFGAWIAKAQPDLEKVREAICQI